MMHNAASQNVTSRSTAYHRSAGRIWNRRWTKSLLMTLLITGCSEVRRDYIGYSSTALSTVQIGTSRQAVEDVLGRSVTGYDSNAGRVETYEYNKGIESRDDLELSDHADAILTVGLKVVFWPLAIPADLASGACDFDGQKGLLNVTYDDLEMVVAVEEEHYQPSAACD
jgi:hypothetical protein